MIRRHGAEDTCRLCAQKITSQECFDSHTSSETISGVKIFNCRLCAEEFSDQESALKHLRCHNLVQVYPCLQCQETFRCPSDVRVHTRLVHKGKLLDENIVLELCQYDKLELHLARVS